MCDPIWQVTLHRSEVGFPFKISGKNVFQTQAKAKSQNRPSVPGACDFAFIWVSVFTFSKTFFPENLISKKTATDYSRRKWVEITDSETPRPLRPGSFA